MRWASRRQPAGRRRRPAGRAEHACLMVAQLRRQQFRSGFDVMHALTRQRLGALEQLAPRKGDQEIGRAHV